MSFLREVSRTIVAIDLLFLVLLGLTFLVVEPGSGAFVVATLTLVPIALTLLGALGVLYTGFDPF